MYALRTRIKKDIVAEFLPPTRATKKQKVIIFCDGMPAMPSKGLLMEFFSKKGYWVFYPRYRGSWESGGEFLKISPTQDVLDLISALPKGFVSLWDNRKYKVNPDKIYVFGISFGGPAAILSSLDRRVTRAIAISPVVDWREDKYEPLDWAYRFTKEAFGGGYRLKKTAWQKLARGNFYNPIKHTAELDGEKLFIIHAKDDKVVPFGPTKKFAEKIGATFVPLVRGGHLSSSILIKRKNIYKKLQKFLKS